MDVIGWLVLIFVVYNVISIIIANLPDNSSKSKYQKTTLPTTTYRRNSFPETNETKLSIQAIIQKAIDEKRSIFITYCKYDGSTSQRQLSKIEYCNEFSSYGFTNDHIKGFCHLRKEYRVFRINRITAIKML